jgi:riboflavin synthase
MFTGIIHGTARVRSFEPAEAGARIEIETGIGADDPISRGESIAVNGVCLTALPLEGSSFYADLSPETLALTNLGDLASGEVVNIERSLALGARLGGHLVQGHVDTVGTLLDTRNEGEFAVYRWSYPAEFRTLVIPKGSIAVDGISLTIVDPDESSFSVALIPETLQRTNLGGARRGQRFNLEFDVMAKYARAMFEAYLSRPQPA